MNDTRSTALPLVALWLAIFTDSAQFLVVAPMIPRIAEQLEVPEQGLGILMTAYAAVLAIGAVVSGPISDKVGRRAMLVFGTLWTTVALLAHAGVTTVDGLILARAATGLGAGALIGAGVAWVADAVPEGRRGRALSVLATGFAAGQVLGVPLGAVLAEQSFRLPFVMFGGLMAVASGLVIWKVHAPDVPRVAHMDVRRAVQAYGSLLSRRSTAAAVAAYVVSWGSVAVLLTHLAGWLEGRYDTSSRAVALLFLIGGLANLLGAVVGGRLTDRYGAVKVTGAASLAMTALLLIGPKLTPTFVAAVVGVSLVMFVLGTRYPSIDTLTASLVRASRRGTLMSLASAGGSAGFAVGSWIADPVNSTFGFYGNLAAAAVLSAAVAALIVLGVGSRRADPATDVPLEPRATGPQDA